MRIVQPGKTEQAFRHTENLLQGTVKGGDNLLSKRRVEPGAACLNDAQRRKVAVFPLTACTHNCASAGTRGDVSHSFLRD